MSRRMVQLNEQGESFGEAGRQRKPLTLNERFSQIQETFERVEVKTQVCVALARTLPHFEFSVV